MNAELVKKAARAALRAEYGFSPSQAAKFPKRKLEGSISESVAKAVLRVAIEACAEICDKLGNSSGVGQEDERAYYYAAEEIRALLELPQDAAGGKR